jgi:hypothetical protein
LTSDDKRRYRVQTPADSSLKNPSGSLPTGTIGGESIPFFPSALFAKAALARFSALSFLPRRELTINAGYYRFYLTLIDVQTVI